MAKKIKSFTVDEKAYDALVTMFKENKGETSISFCFDKYVKELLTYIRSVKEGLSESASYTVPLSFIMDSVVNVPNFKLLEKEPLSGESKSSLNVELDKWQKKYDEKTSKELRLTIDPAIFDHVSKSAKEYGVTDVVSFFFKVMAKRATEGRDLNKKEYEDICASMGEGFDGYRKEKIIPAFDKADNKLNKLLKPFGLKVDTEE